MAGARQKPPDQLVNRRGGRDYGVGVRAPAAERRVPALPRAITKPEPVWLPPGLMRGWVEVVADRKMAPAGMSREEWLAANGREFLLEARAELDRIAREAQRQARAEWRGFWLSDTSLPCRPEDMDALNAWIICVFEWWLFEPIARTMPLVQGSMGNWVRTPLDGRVSSLRAHIRATEDRFGMNTQSRYRMHLHHVEDVEPEDSEFDRALRGG